MSQVTCANCGILFEKSPSQVQRYTSHYCSRSCSAQTNNRLIPKRRKTKHCCTCDALISQRQTYCAACWSEGLKRAKPTVKRCSQCQSVKPITDFYAKGKTIGSTQSFCKSCFNAYCIRRWQERKKQAVEHLGGRCQDCGGLFHPNVYDFHHLRDKDFVWEKLRLRSWKQITEELENASCCARTVTERGMWKRRKEKRKNKHPTRELNTAWLV